MARRRVTSMVIGVDADAQQFDSEMAGVVDEVEQVRREVEKPITFGGMAGGAGAMASGAMEFFRDLPNVISEMRGWLEDGEEEFNRLAESAENAGQSLAEFTGGVLDAEDALLVKLNPASEIMSDTFGIALAKMHASYLQFEHSFATGIARLFGDNTDFSLERLQKEFEELQLREEQQKKYNELLKEEEKIQADIQRTMERREQQRQFAAIDRQIQADLAALSREQFMAGQERRREEMMRRGVSARGIEFELAKQLEAFNEREQFAERRRTITDEARNQKTMIKQQEEELKLEERSVVAAEALLQLQQQRSNNSVEVGNTTGIR